MNLLLLLWSLLGTADAARSGWDVRMLIDNSCSMNNLSTVNDPDGYALIAPAILSDFAGRNDRLTVYDQDTLSPLRVQNTPSSKNQLPKLGETSKWENALKAAVNGSISTAGSNRKRMVIMISDADKSGSTVPAQRLLQSGATGMVIGVGPAQNKPNVMNMFGPDRARYVPKGNGGRFLKAMADAFGYLLGSVPSQGRDRPDAIAVEVEPDVEEAWLVVLADAPVNRIDSSTGTVERPTNAGWTNPNSNRSYNVVKLPNPKAGKWTFNASTSASTVDWLLIQTFEYGDLKVKVGPCAANAPCTVTASFDGKTPSKATVVATPEGGSPITLTRQPDGTYKGQVTFTSPGTKTLTTVATAGKSYKTEDRQTVTVDKATGHLLCDPGPTVVPAGGKFPFVRQQGVNHPLDQAWASIDGTRINLKRKGGGYGGTAPIPAMQGEVKVTIGSTAGGVSSECEETWLAQPSVSLAVTAPSSIPIGPNRLAPFWNPFACTTDNPAVLANDPKKDCNACGGCSGASDFADSSGTSITPSVAVKATIELVSPLPRHVKLFAFSDGKYRSVSTGSQTEFLLDPSKPVLSAAVCGGTCPKGGSHPLTFIVRVPDVFDASGSTITTVEQTVTATLDVSESSWWTCYAMWIYLAIVGLLVTVVAYGYVYPLKFGRQANFPTHIRAVHIERFNEITDGNFAPDIKRKAKRAWYRDQKIWVTVDGSLRDTERTAAIRIELRREEGRIEAWIVPIAGQWLAHGAPGTPTTRWSRELIQPGVGAPLELDHIYVAFSSKDADQPSAKFFCLLFEQQ